jgi:hypothetical protein
MYVPWTMMKTLLFLLLAPLLMATAFNPTPLHQGGINVNVKTSATARKDKDVSCSSGWCWKQSVETVQQTGLALLAPDAAFAKGQAIDISGQDFSGQDLSHKDFTGVMAKGTDFHNSNLQGSVFSSANLVNADFSGADLQGANFVDATLDGTKFKNAQAQNAVFGATILDVADMENIDLTSSLWPSKYRIMICDMDELKGKNPVTGADSRESIQCTDFSHRS